MKSIARSIPMWSVVALPPPSQWRHCSPKKREAPALQIYGGHRVVSPQIGTLLTMQISRTAHRKLHLHFSDAILDSCLRSDPNQPCA
jgi:hypothetical protein